MHKSLSGNIKNNKQIILKIHCTYINFNIILYHSNKNDVYMYNMIIITLAITNSNPDIVQSFLGYIELLNLVNYAIWYSSSCIYTTILK